MAEAPPLTIEQATTLLREKTGKPITVRSVRDVSARFVVLRQRVETRVVEVVRAPEPSQPAPSQAVRDLAAELWSLDVQPGEHPARVITIEDPRTGAVRRCTSCHGSRRRNCDRCAGLNAINCGVCGGYGRYRDARGTERSCGVCGGDGRAPCGRCFGGTIPCDHCSEQGSVYTVQRVRVAWCDRECRSIVHRPPTAIDIDSAPAERVGEVEFDGDVPRPIAGGSMDHFRASAGRDEDLRAIAALAATHPAGPNERVLSQRASIERVSIWEVACDPDVVVYLVGPERRLLGERALRTGPGPAVAIVTLVLGVIAIFAGSVLR